MKVSEAGLVPDLVTVTAKLKDSGRLEISGGTAYLATALDLLPSATGLPSYVALVQEAALRRKALRLASRLTTAAQSGKDVESAIAEFREQASALGASRRSKANVVCLDDVQPLQTEWLWPSRIPLREVTLVEGDPGKGKSTLTLQLGAAATRGAMLCNEGPLPRGNVLLLSAEDDLSRTVRPRAEEAGADLKLFHALTGISATREGTNQRELTLDDLNMLEEVISRIRPILVIIDPIQAYLGAEVDAHRANEVRPRLRALAQIAAKHRCAVVLVRHLSKGTVGGKLLHRGLGSVDFAAAARSILHVARHPDDEEDKGRRVLVHVKSNLSALSPTLGFSIIEGKFKWDGVADVGESAVQADEAGKSRRPRGRPPAERAAAEAWLKAALANGPQLARDLMAHGEVAGHAERTLDRAAARLKVVRDHRPGSASIWRLPSPDSLDNQLWRVGIQGGQEPPKNGGNPATFVPPHTHSPQFPSRESGGAAGSDSGGLEQGGGS